MSTKTYTLCGDLSFQEYQVLRRNALGVLTWNCMHFIYSETNKQAKQGLDCMYSFCDIVLPRAHSRILKRDEQLQPQCGGEKNQTAGDSLCYSSQNYKTQTMTACSSCDSWSLHTSLDWDIGDWASHGASWNTRRIPKSDYLADSSGTAMVQGAWAQVDTLWWMPIGAIRCEVNGIRNRPTTTPLAGTAMYPQAACTPTRGVVIWPEQIPTRNDARHQQSHSSTSQPFEITWWWW